MFEMKLILKRRSYHLLTPLPMRKMIMRKFDIFLDLLFCFITSWNFMFQFLGFV
ncbi:unnamed protein product [Brassica oleracea var. botrytis]|uniref:(rape) hypothetical protein n=1 Tax=Brassica napus TaxID=3708 RepID=A0A816S4V1_BRANA|nr:unnamed protein product [Brassica napus]